jgi:hypothetical protein
MGMLRLTKQEREERILDLYYNQNKTYREIAKLERICPRDIGTIVNKESRDIESKQSQSKAAQAYDQFSRGKSPMEVAISLNLREPEVTQLYKESWNLKQIGDLNRIYLETSGNLAPFLALYKKSEAAGFNVKHVVWLLGVATKGLPEFEYKYYNLRSEVDSLEAQKQSSVSILEEYEGQIWALGQTFDNYCSSCQEEGARLNDLQQKRSKLEAAVRHFINNNEEYLKIRKKVQEELINILSDPKALLMSALWILFKSMRNDPEKFISLIYYRTSAENISYDSRFFYGTPYMPGCRQQQYSSEEEFMKDCAYMLVEEADKLFGDITKEFLDKIINDSSHSGPASSSFPSLPPTSGYK